MPEVTRAFLRLCGASQQRHRHRNSISAPGPFPALEDDVVVDVLEAPERTSITRREYESQKAWGMSLHLGLHGCEPAVVGDPAEAERCFAGLAALLAVQCPRSAPVVRLLRDPGAGGYSLVQVLDSALVSMHVAETANAVYLDIFSSGYFDARQAAVFAAQIFGSESVRGVVTLRR